MKRPSQSAALAFRLEGIAEFAEGATVPVSVQLLRDAAATLRAQAAALAEREAECERLREALGTPLDDAKAAEKAVAYLQALIRLEAAARAALAQAGEG